MGVLDLVKFNMWTLISADPEITFKDITGEFHPDDGLEVNGEPLLEFSSTAGSARPNIQWVAGGARSFRIASRFRSRHSLEDIRSKIEVLDRLTAQDPTLGRGPRVSWAWGDYEITGYATAKYRITGLWVTGLPKQAIFELEIVEDPPSEGEGGGAGETQYLRLGAGETFEGLGWRYLRSALRGELIRRQNPTDAHRPEAAGDLVKVFEREHPALRGAVLPTGVPFLDAGWAAEVDALGESRGTSERGLTYDALPEVLAGLV